MKLLAFLLASLQIGIGQIVAACMLIAIPNPGQSKELRSRWGKDWFPNTELVNQDGKTLKFYDDLIKDKVVAINFIFTSCPNSCPLETAKLKQVYDHLRDRMGKDVFFISISIDPATDTPTVLKSYMKKFKLGSGWQLLTGKKEEINLLRAKLGLLNTSSDANEEKIEDHSLNFIIGNEATGQWVRRSPMDNAKLIAGLLRDDLLGSRTARSGAGSYANVPKAPTQMKGEVIFRTRCLSCHTIGGGESVGPDLLNVTRKRDPVWLHQWIKEPDVMLAAKDPLAMSLFEQYNEIIMPNLKLSNADVKGVVTYIEFMSKKNAAAP